MAPLLLHPTSSSEATATAHKTTVRVGPNTIASVRRGRRGVIATATAAGIGRARLPAKRKIQRSLRAAGERSVLGADRLGAQAAIRHVARLWYFDLHAADIVAAYRRLHVTELSNAM